MIHTEAGFHSAKEALALVESALQALRRDAARYHPTTFVALQEPYLDEIQRLQMELQSYTGSKFGGVHAETPHSPVAL